MSDNYSPRCASVSPNREGREKTNAKVMCSLCARRQSCRVISSATVIPPLPEPEFADMPGSWTKAFTSIAAYNMQSVHVLKDRTSSFPKTCHYAIACQFCHLSSARLLLTGCPQSVRTKTTWPDSRGLDTSECRGERGFVGQDGNSSSTHTVRTPCVSSSTSPRHLSRNGSSTIRDGEFQGSAINVPPPM